MKNSNALKSLFLGRFFCAKNLVKNRKYDIIMLVKRENERLG